MNKKKRRVAVLLSATIGSAVLVLSGCSGKSDQTEKTLRVGVITYTQDDPFINGLTDELKAQLKAMENKERRIIVSTKSGNDDQQEQNEKVEEMVRKIEHKFYKMQGYTTEYKVFQKDSFSMDDDLERFLYSYE